MKEFLGQTDMNDGTWCMCVFAYSLTSLKKCKMFYNYLNK